MKIVILKLILLVGNIVTKIGAVVGIAGAIISICCLEELGKYERQKR